MANHLTILRHVETGEETVEGLLEHSKTKRKRYVNAVGTSRGPAAVTRYASPITCATSGARSVLIYTLAWRVSTISSGLTTTSFAFR